MISGIGTKKKITGRGTYLPGTNQPHRFGFIFPSFFATSFAFFLLQKKKKMLQLILAAKNFYQIVKGVVKENA